MSAIETINAVDLLTGIVLVLVLYLIKKVLEQGNCLATLNEKVKHLPTKEEVVIEIQKTRHTLRNEMQKAYAEHTEEVEVKLSTFASEMSKLRGAEQ